MISLYVGVKIKRGNFQVDAEFTIPNGGITALFGPSGCGKSTLLRAIAGLKSGNESQQGVIRLSTSEGNFSWLHPSQVSVPTWQRKVGFVFQQPALLPHLSVAKNLDFAWKRVERHERDKYAIFEPSEVARICGITEFLDRKPEQLSGGQQQRIAIARALVSCPQVLLFDEPLSNLDHLAKTEFIQLIKHIHKIVKIPMLFVSHQLDEVVQLADYLLLMEDGKLLVSGHITEVLQTKEGFARCRGENIISGIVSNQQSEKSGLLSISVAGHEINLPDPKLQNTKSTEVSIEQVNARNVEQTEGGTSISNPARSILEHEFTPGSCCRIHIRARELIIATEKNSETSIQNFLPGKIISFHATYHPAELRICIAIDEKNHADNKRNEQVVSAVITKSSAERLHLVEQMSIYLQIKAVALSY